MIIKPARIGHYFFPQPSNNHKARLLQPSFLSLIVAVFLTSQFFLNYFSLQFPRILGYAANISPERLIELTNQERLKNGLVPLENNSVLNEAAKRKAGDMFAFNYWAHNSPSGRTPWAFFKETGYYYLCAGENLARDFNDSEAVVAAWMDSPTHKENILNVNYQEIGIAVLNGTLEGIETTLVVQLFGTPVTAVASSVETVKTIEPLSKPALASGEATTSAFSQLLASTELEEEKSSWPLLSPFSVTKNLIIFLAGLVIGIFVLDLYFITRKKVIRLSSRSLAHLTFLVFLILAVLMVQPGLIL
jgi:hypothetical protein